MCQHEVSFLAGSLTPQVCFVHFYFFWETDTAKLPPTSGEIEHVLWCVAQEEDPRLGTQGKLRHVVCCSLEFWVYFPGEERVLLTVHQSRAPVSSCCQCGVDSPSAVRPQQAEISMGALFLLGQRKVFRLNVRKARCE